MLAPAVAAAASLPSCSAPAWLDLRLAGWQKRWKTISAPVVQQPASPNLSLIRGNEMPGQMSHLLSSILDCRGECQTSRGAQGMWNDGPVGQRHRFSELLSAGQQALQPHWAPLQEKKGVQQQHFAGPLVTAQQAATRWGLPPATGRLALSA